MNALPSQATNQRSILIVDRSAEVRDVLRTVLEQRGMRILEAEQAREGIGLAEQHHPHVIVWNGDETGDDAPASEAETVEAKLRNQSRRDGASLVILASARRSGEDRGSTVVSKPYHYGPLIRKIESLAARAGGV